MGRIATMTWGRRHHLTLLLLTPVLTGCNSWQTVRISPRQLIEARGPVAMRVTQSDGTRIQLRDPWIVGDSIVAEGLWRRAVGRPTAGIRKMRWLLYEGTVRIALDDIVAVEERRLSVFRTALASAAALVATVVIVVLVGQDYWYYT